MEKTENKASFVSQHADTFAIIGVNLAGLALLVSMWLSHANRMDSVNTRMDTIQSLMYQEMKDFHGRLSILEQRNQSFIDRARRVE